MQEDKYYYVHKGKNLGIVLKESEGKLEKFASPNGIPEGFEAKLENGELIVPEEYKFHTINSEIAENFKRHYP